jgi:hypothetical protein
VADISTGIDDIERALKYCRLDWVPDAYFADLGQNRSVAPKPPAAPTAATQGTLKKHCVAEFTAASNMPVDAAGATRASGLGVADDVAGNSLHRKP